MLKISKKFFSAILSIILLWTMLPTNLSAQSVDLLKMGNQPKSPQQNIEYFQNLKFFFSTFFDLDNSLNYMLDDIFIQNTCIKRDVFGLVSAKNMISDFMLDNYTKVTPEMLKQQQEFYQNYSAEISFLRNIDYLWDSEQGKFTPTPAKVSALRQKVASSSKLGQSKVEELMKQWILDYEEKFEEYSSCSMWKEVIEKSTSIKEKALSFKEIGSDLGKSIADLGKEIYDTPGKFTDNTVDAVVDSWNDSIDEFKKSYIKDEDGNMGTAWQGPAAQIMKIGEKNNERKENIKRAELDSRKQVESIRNSLQTDFNQTVIIDTTQPLTEIATTLTEASNLTEIIADYEEQTLKSLLETSGNDKAASLLYSRMLVANLDITETTRTLSHDNGILATVSLIKDKQCNLKAN